MTSSGSTGSPDVSPALAARAAGAASSQTRARVAVTGTRPVMLPDFTDARRQPTRPPEARDADFTVKFDAETLFYDAFVGTRGHIVLAGPPFLNLKPALAAATIVAQPSGAACPFTLRELDRHGQIHVAAPDGTRALTLTSALGTVTIAVQASEADIFAGRRVLFTQSRDNDLAWIQDWVRFSRDVHGADAVLIYDNASTRYTPGDLAEAVGALAGIAAVRIVDWPFKFGPQGFDARSYWDSDFGQHGAWEHARRQFLEAAASVQVSDIDELILTEDGCSLFEAVEASPFGLLRYEGRWVVGREGATADGDAAHRRHRDYTVVLRQRPVKRFGILTVDGDRCPPKWSLVPSRIPDSAQWKVHSVGGYLPSRGLTRRFGYRHFREITNNWKYERTSAEQFDPALHAVDDRLKAHFDRVDWTS